MKNVMSVRVDSESLRRIRELARRERNEVSTVARELIDHGWMFLMLRDYREGRISLGTFAQKLRLPLAEAIDLLADPIEYDDYLKGLAVAAAFVKAKDGSPGAGRA